MAGKLVTPKQENLSPFLVLRNMQIKGRFYFNFAITQVYKKMIITI